MTTIPLNRARMPLETINPPCSVMIRQKSKSVYGVFNPVFNKGEAK